MVRSPAGRALVLAYVVVVTGAVGAMILLGFAIERVLPSSARRGYERAMFAAVGLLARPVDGLASRPPERAAGYEAGEPTG